MFRIVPTLPSFHPTRRLTPIYRDKRVAAFGPDQGLACEIYTSGQCGIDAGASDKSFYAEYPGVANLATVGFAGNVQSWVCWKKA